MSFSEASNEEIYDNPELSNVETFVFEPEEQDASKEFELSGFSFESHSYSNSIKYTNDSRAGRDSYSSFDVDMEPEDKAKTKQVKYYSIPLALKK